MIPIPILDTTTPEPGIGSVDTWYLVSPALLSHQCTWISDYACMYHYECDCFYGALFPVKCMQTYARVKRARYPHYVSSCTGVCLWLSQCHWPNIPGLEKPKVMEVWRTGTPIGTVVAGVLCFCILPTCSCSSTTESALWEILHKGVVERLIWHEMKLSPL